MSQFERNRTVAGILGLSAETFSVTVCIRLHTPEFPIMTHRINVIVQDDTWRFLQSIPPGQRSSTINQALREWALKRRRIDAAAEMDRFRDEMAAHPVTTAEVLSWIRADRDGGH